MWTSTIKPPADQLAGLLSQLALTEPEADMNGQPSDLDHEFALMLGQGEPLEHLHHIGRPSTYACPDCHGALWQINDSKPVRYRCHTGHGYTERSLESTMSVEADAVVWQALRALQERRLLTLDMAAQQEGEDKAQAAVLRAAAQALEHDAAALRAMLERPAPTAEDDPARR